MFLFAWFHVFLTCVAVNGENMILIATKYGVSDPLSDVGWVTGFHFCNPSAFTKRKYRVQ